MVEIMIKEVERQLMEWKLNVTETPVVIGVSGGVDSMVLLHILNQLSAKDEYQAIQWIVAHFNHNLRETSDRDMNLVKDYAAKLNLPYFVEYWQQPSVSNVEADAREARYQFLAQVVKSVGGHTLITAHHLSDQVETHLMRLVRGTSIKGWNGISDAYERQVVLGSDEKMTLRILRPLLKISKEQIYAFAEMNQIPYFEDETNHTNYYLRNRIRHHVVPIMQEENPKFLDHVSQMIDHLTLSYNAHYEQFIVIEPNLVTPNHEHGWTLNLEEWWRLSRSTFSIYLRILFEERIVNAMGKYSQVMLNQLESIMRRDSLPNVSIDIGNNWVAEREYMFLKIKPQRSQTQSLTINESYRLEPNNQWIQISRDEFIGFFDQSRVTQMVESGQTLVYHLNLSNISNPYFEIRHRKPGDYMCFAPKEGPLYHKKLRRMFIDEKVTAEERKNMWLVTDESRVLWAIGMAKGYYNLIETEQEITHSILYQKRKN